jgi:hypothetical protein
MEQISIDQLEEILYRENSVIDPDDVELLLVVIRKEITEERPKP